MVSVKKAILIGNLILSVPVLVIITAFIGIGYFYVSFHQNDVVNVLFLLVVALIVSIIYASIVRRKYLSWVYLNVDDFDSFVSKAKKVGVLNRNFNSHALEMNLISKGFFRSFSQVEKEKNIKKVPVEFNIYYDKFRIYISLSVVIMSIIGLVYMQDLTWLIIFMAVLILSMGDIKNISNTKPQIVFTRKGVLLPNGTFLKWEELTYISAGKSKTGNSWETYLTYSVKDSKLQTISISKYNITVNKLTNMIEQYKYQFCK